MVRRRAPGRCLSVCRSVSWYFDAPDRAPRASKLSSGCSGDALASVRRLTSSAGTIIAGARLETIENFPTVSFLQFPVRFATSAGEGQPSENKAEKKRRKANISTRHHAGLAAFFPSSSRPPSLHPVAPLRAPLWPSLTMATADVRERASAWIAMAARSHAPIRSSAAVLPRRKSSERSIVRRATGPTTTATRAE